MIKIELRYEDVKFLREFVNRELEKLTMILETAEDKIKNLTGIIDQLDKIENR